MKLYFIGGASGSGKTAIIPGLQKILGSEIKVYDFDDIGVPEGADKKWRQEATEKWLQQLLSYKKNTCLVGVVLGEILACPSAKHIKEIHFLLLDVDDVARIKRIRTRGDVAYINQYILNWASWLRVHNQEPKWEQSVIKDDSWDGLDFSSWDQIKNWPSNVTTKTIDTTYLDIKEVAEQVAAWMNDKQIEFKIIEYGSEMHKQAILLQEDNMHKPLGLRFTEKELLVGKEQVQVVGIKDDVVVATTTLVSEGLDCKMERLVVDKSLVNRGIGSKMMDFCESYAKENKFNSIYSHIRDTAFNFYFKNKYIAETDFFDEEAIPHLKMRKLITPGVILLNGPSSSGKTTLSKKLQGSLKTPYLHIGIDKIISMIPKIMNNSMGEKVEPFFWWNEDKDELGNKLAYIQLGPFAYEMYKFLKKVVLLALDSGHSVIIDEVCIVDGSFDEWQRILSPWNVLYVGIKSKTDVLEQREKERGNRMIGSARAQNLYVHDNKKYDLELHTDVLTLEECVSRVIVSLGRKKCPE